LVDENRVGRFVSQTCEPGGARDSKGFERLVVDVPGGESLQLLCRTTPVAVIEELDIRIWVKASRPDIQIAARAMLPRTVKDDGQSALSAIVRGEKYSRAGHWQQLVLKDVPRSLAAETRVLRTTRAATIDAREAYVDAVVLIVPGDPAGIEIATDELVVDGVARPISDDVQLASYPAAARTNAPQTAATPAAQRPIGASLRRLPDSAAPNQSQEHKSTVRMQADLLLVNDRPFMPRAIQWQGEPLQLLVERGFNAAWLDRPPTAEESADALRHGMWFICVPPKPDTLVRDGLGQPDDRVIAWQLDDDALENDPKYANRWADLVRERDAVAKRPVIIAPVDQWNSASKSADVLLATRPRINTASGDNYQAWLTSRAAVARPGTPLWSLLPTQYDATAGRQISALLEVDAAPPCVDARLLDSMTDAACTSGMRGFVFRSASPLNEPDNATRARIVNLELINRRLQRLEPWLASGKVLGRYSSTDSDVTAVVMHVDHAQLLVPVSGTATSDQAAKDVTLVVPGVSESCRVYAFSPVALKPLPVQRVAGGTKFNFQPLEDTFILLTENPRVVQSLRQHISQYGERIVRLRRESAALQLASLNDTTRRLAQAGFQITSASQIAASASGMLQQADTALASRYLDNAYQAVAGAGTLLDQAAGELQRIASVPAVKLSNPLALDGSRLADFAAFERAYPSFRTGDNLLYGGDFEDLGQMAQYGWRHVQSTSVGVESQAELSASEPRHGQYCLMLQAFAAPGGQARVDGAPVWVESPPVPIREEQVLEISGWVRVDATADGSEGLTIVDSLGGPQLALAIGQTNGWERFRIIRAAADSSELRVTFALSGLGTARLDALMVRTLEQPPSRRLPILVPATGAPATKTPTNPPPAAAPTATAPFVTPQTR
jgi:hypothetical protein